VEQSNAVVLGGLAETHQPSVAGKNQALTAINSAIQIDLSGQINAERIDTRQLSAPGGQPDFVRAARQSAGGRSVIALTNTVQDRDISKIVAGIPEESVVTTPRYEPDFVVTEDNVVDFRTSSVRERAAELIRAAASEYRESLAEAAVDQQLLLDTATVETGDE
jgi:4-hydroxybutyrate CoA-transferase